MVEQSGDKNCQYFFFFLCMSVKLELPSYLTFTADMSQTDWLYCNSYLVQF